MNKPNVAPGNILAGVADYVDHWLGTRRYKNSGRSGYLSLLAAQEVSEKGSPLGKEGLIVDSVTLLQNLLKLIDENWLKFGSRAPSTKIWTLEKKLNLPESKYSAEKKLENIIVQLLNNTWYNHICASSELNPMGGPLHCIDIGHDCGNGKYELIELKYGTLSDGFGSENPLAAAWEIMTYGLLYIHARSNKNVLIERAEGIPLLQAREIQLCVLAPKEYYYYTDKAGKKRRFEFKWLEKDLNQALNSLLIPVHIHFQFQQFTPEFENIFEQTSLLAAGVNEFTKANLKHREPVY